MLEPKSSISRNIRIFFRTEFSYYLSLGLKSAPGGPIIHYLVNRKNLSKDLEYICNIYVEKFLLGYPQLFS